MSSDSVLSNVTPRIWRLSEISTLLPATMTCLGRTVFWSRLPVPKYIRDDLLGLSSKPFIQNQCCKLSTQACNLLIALVTGCYRAVIPAIARHLVSNEAHCIQLCFEVAARCVCNCQYEWFTTQPESWWALNALYDTLRRTTPNILHRTWQNAFNFIQHFLLSLDWRRCLPLIWQCLFSRHVR